LNLRAWGLSAFVVCGLAGALGAFLVWGLNASNYGNTILFPVFYAAAYLTLVIPVSLGLMFGGCVIAGNAAHALAY
jgi:hypothetical protein